MILIDQVLRFGDEDIETQLTVRNGGLFSQDDGSLPAWVGIELMAQSVAAYAGCHARQLGQPVELGFLLGTRNFVCNVDRFPAGTTLHIHATRSLQDDNGMCVFECRLEGPDILVEARLNVFQPRDVTTYIQESPISQEPSA
jgi:predicted hotdog family 3-hydroxylacyl-ACP dehydratase